MINGSFTYSDCENDCNVTNHCNRKYGYQSHFCNCHYNDLWHLNVNSPTEMLWTHFRDVAFPIAVREWALRIYLSNYHHTWMSFRHYDAGHQHFDDIKFYLMDMIVQSSPKLNTVKPLLQGHSVVRPPLIYGRFSQPFTTNFPYNFYWS